MHRLNWSAFPPRGNVACMEFIFQTDIFYTIIYLISESDRQQ